MGKGIIYDSAAIYISEAKDLRERIKKIDNIITGLLAAVEASTENESIESYTLDDGQTRISTNYRSAESAFEAVQKFENIKTYYINKLNGRQMTLMDRRNFRYPRY